VINTAEPGKSDPDVMLRTYTHLLPPSETRTGKAIDDDFTETPVPEAQGTSAFQQKQYALAA